jgi:predicted metal-dependent enzyme (double-stranded beta helix superfamily)
MILNPQLVRTVANHRRQPEKILALFSDSGFDAAALSRINDKPDPKQPYSRAVLSASPACEVMLARWSPGRTCAPHDHGASSGWVFYLEQDFEEQGYAWRDGALAPAWTSLHRAGTYTEVRQREIHSCVCHGPGLSLHVYFPRIEKMRVYDLAERRTITVADDCGAWIPDRPEQLIHEAAWR